MRTTQLFRFWKYPTLPFLVCLISTHEDFRTKILITTLKCLSLMKTGKIHETKCMTRQWVLDKNPIDRVFVVLRLSSALFSHTETSLSSVVYKYDMKVSIVNAFLLSYIKVRHNTNVQNVSAKFWLAENHVFTFCFLFVLEFFIPLENHDAN